MLGDIIVLASTERPAYKKASPEVSEEAFQKIIRGLFNP